MKNMIGGVLILKKYRIFIVVMIILSCIYSGLFFVFSVDKISSVYIQESKDSILQLKKTFLKDTVNNLIREIDVERELQAVFFEDEVEKTFSTLNFSLGNSDDVFKDEFIKYFEIDAQEDFYTIIIWDNTTGKEVYDPENIADESWDGSMDVIEKTFSSYKLISHGNLKAVYGVKKSHVDEIVQNIIIDKIRYSKFSEDSYIWINEVVNYEGGDNYAIRRVHPNLPETEGTYLSTNTSDGYGNYPYKEELDGVNKNGEIFFSYYFKKLNSDVVSQKVTFSKLYKDYNWIIAMGVHLDDIQAYVDQTQVKSKNVTQKLTIGLVIAFIVILIISFTIIRTIDRWFFKHSKKLMESEINQDSLTKAASRRSGTNDLAHFFKKFKKDRNSPAIMLIDVDKFKEINDTYGHVVGDQLLVEVVKTIFQVVRSTDRIIRWGGDEFIGVFYGLKKENAEVFSKKLLSDIASLEIKAEDEIVKATVSIGLSYFNEKDSDYLEALKRADEAMYTSKREGRNRVNIIS